jgi:hypothetical protein
MASGHGVGGNGPSILVGQGVVGTSLGGSSPRFQKNPIAPLVQQVTWANSSLVLCSFNRAKILTL